MKTPIWIKRWQTLVVLSLVALMAMVIVACGDDDEETPAATAAPTAAPAPAPTAAPQPTAAPTPVADNGTDNRGTDGQRQPPRPDSPRYGCPGNDGSYADEAKVHTCGNGDSGTDDRGGGDG